MDASGLTSWVYMLCGMMYDVATMYSLHADAESSSGMYIIEVKCSILMTLLYCTATRNNTSKHINLQTHYIVNSMMALTMSLSLFLSAVTAWPRVHPD